MVRLLLAHGADATLRDRGGRTALMDACTAGRLPVVGDLLSHGLSPIDAVENSGYTALALASSAGRTAVVRTLLQDEADATIATKSDETPLTLATTHKHQGCVAWIQVRGLAGWTFSLEGWS